MAPRDIQQQTYEIVLCLFDPSPESSDIKTFQDIEADSADDESDSFDPVLIAHKLREVADELDEQVIREFKNALESASQKQVEAAFRKTAEALCRTWMSERGEVAMEKHLLRAAVALGLYAKRSCPRMIPTVQGAVASFLNAYVTPWVRQQGGWDRVASA